MNTEFYPLKCPAIGRRVARAHADLSSASAPASRSSDMTTLTPAPPLHRYVLGLFSLVTKCTVLRVRTNGVWKRPMPTLSDALSCREYVEDSLFSWAGVGGCSPPWEEGLQGAQSPALDNIVTDSVYIIYILPHNFSGTFPALLCYHGQECGGVGRFLHEKIIYIWTLD